MNKFFHSPGPLSPMLILREYVFLGIKQKERWEQPVPVRKQRTTLRIDYMWLCKSGGFNRTKGGSVESQTDRTWKIFIYLFTPCGICGSVAKSCPTLCNQLNCSTPGFPVLHYLPEFAHTHVHWVSDAIQLSHPQLPPLLPPILPSIRVYSNESNLHMRWPSIGVSALASFLPKNIQGWSSEWTGWISLLSKGLSRVFSNTTVQKHQFFGIQPSSESNSHTHTWPLEKP